MLTEQTQKVAILMGTYNGENFLNTQLNSFLNQTHSNWQLCASDDGSKDSTLAILSAFQKEHGEHRLSIYTGLRKGFCANFLSLVCNNHITANYYAYSDQDDLWESNKLQRAIDALNFIDKETPALYCARTAFVNNEHQLLGYSKKFTKKPSFKNALVQCIAGGNTMVFNDAARKLLQKASVNCNVHSHDWWSYLVISGGDGVVIYDDYISLQYRQHGNNQVGMNTTFFAKLFRLRQIFQGDFKDWNNRNVNALLLMQENLSEKNKKTLDDFIHARNGRLFSRLRYFLKSGIYRQTVVGNIGLVIAVFFKKI